MNNLGCSTCRFCGAEYRLFTIFKKDMQVLTDIWKRRHERGCEIKTPKQRLAWAKPYIGKDRYESSIVVDLEHTGFKQSRAQQEVTEELAVLRRLRTIIAPKSLFGEDNIAAIDAQCDVLSKGMQTDEVFRQWEDEYVRDAALYAHNWLNLLGATQPPSQDWQPQPIKR